MQIPYNKFIEKVTESSLHQIGVHAIPRAHKIVVQQYCNKLSLRSACSGGCDTCILKVKDVVDWINTLPDKPQQPYGLYTKMMKFAFGKQVEEMLERPPMRLEVNAFGERTDRDPFAIFEDQFNAR
jgi:hypothetical protein